METTIKEKFESIEYKRTRMAYAAQCTFDYLICLLVSDAFLAKLLTDIGISDSLIGIISSIISFSFLFQLASIWLINIMKNTKRTVICFDCLSQFLFMCMYCVPFVDVNLETKTIIVIAITVLAYFSKYLVSSILFKWANSYVEPSNRGSFSAVKEMISLLCGMMFTLAVGFVVDKYEATGNIKNGFTFIIVILLLLNIFNFISLMKIGTNDTKETPRKVPMREVLANTVGNKNFRSVIILLSLWSVATYMTASFMGTFKTKELMLSVGAVQLINAIANGMRLIFSVPMGKYSDEKTYAKGLELALVIAAVGFAINACTTSKTWWLVIAHTILYNVSIAGTNANRFNITYSYVKSEYIAQAMTIQNSISGVLGFLATLAGSFILSYIQERDNMIFGIPVYGQQILSVISLIIVVVAIIYDRTVIEKQKVMVQ